MIRYLKGLYVIFSLLVGFIILYVSLKVTIRDQGGPYHPEVSKSEEIEKEDNHEADIQVIDKVYAEAEPTRAPRSSNPTPVGEVQSYIKEVFAETNAYSWAYYIANCESHFNPSAISSSGRYVGVFQYDRSTFANNCTGDIYDYKSQVDCTYKLYLKGELWRWPACNKKYQNLS